MKIVAENTDGIIAAEKIQLRRLALRTTTNMKLISVINRSCECLTLNLCLSNYHYPHCDVVVELEDTYPMSLIPPAAIPIEKLLLQHKEADEFLRNAVSNLLIENATIYLNLLDARARLIQIIFETGGFETNGSLVVPSLAYHYLFDLKRSRGKKFFPCFQSLLR